MASHYDIVILGGGTGGYVAAIRAAQLGRSVAVVEKDKLGGTCLHRGCIPSKSLLRSAEVFATAKNAETFGVTASSVAFDLEKAQRRTADIVEQLHKGVQFLMKKYKIDVYHGNGRVIGPSIFSPKSGAVAVESGDGDAEMLVSGHLIIATGSRPHRLPGLEIDGESIVTTDEALRWTDLPKSVVIVGGGTIGVEWASMLSDFGVETTIVEQQPRLLVTEDEDISRELERLLKIRGVRSLTGATLDIGSIKQEDGTVHMNVERKGTTAELLAEKVLVCVGRAANADNIGLENTDVKVDAGFIKVNDHLQTTEPHIYAIGDVIGGPQLAHAASHEAICAVEHICGLDTSPSAPHLVPRCTYTRPEIASVGWTERQARERGYETAVTKVSFKSNGKALIYGEANGFAKVVADALTNDILGVHLIGPQATNYISEAALAQLLDATPWEIGQTIHPHPTFSEVLSEAMLAFDGKSINA